MCIYSENSKRTLSNCKMQLILLVAFLLFDFVVGWQFLQNDSKSVLSKHLDLSRDEWQALTGKKNTLRILEVKNCGKPSDALLLKELEVEPDVLHRGEKVCLNADGILRQEVASGAYMKVKLYVGRLMLFDGTMDLCRELDKLAGSDTPKCPLEPGKLCIRHEEPIPDYVPKGIYTFKTVGFTKDDCRIFCLAGRFSVE